MSQMSTPSRCRSCLSEGEADVSLFDSFGAPSNKLTYADMLAECTGTPVARDDDLPDVVCAPCAERLPQVFAFVRTCRKADRALRSLAEDTPLEDDPDPASPAEVPEKRPRSPSTSDYECASCGKRFKRKNDFVVHNRTHTGEKPFACDSCPRRFAQSSTLAEHRRLHTGERPFACPICRKSFGTRSSFWRHGRVHTRERPYSCELCGKSFSHSSTLKHHGLVHTDERPHECETCGKSLKSKYALAQHMMVHAGKQHVCEHCGKRFSMKPNLAGHIKTMHSESAGKCFHCKKETSDLKRHMLTHSADAQYRCGVCDRTFKTRNSLSGHAVMHANADKYRCETDGCGKAFPKRNMLDFHIRKAHSYETSHMCQFCSRGYFRTSDLSRHLNLIHPNEKNGSL